MKNNVNLLALGIIVVILCVLTTGCFDSDENTLEKELLERLDQNGSAPPHPPAQFNLGDCYYSGKGVEQSYEEAVKWFRKAAEQGYADAQWMLGVCYYEGKGIEQSYTEAVKWYRMAAEQGSERALKALQQIQSERVQK